MSGPAASAQDSIRPSAASSFWGGTSTQPQVVKPQTPLFVPQNYESRTPAFRSGASSFPAATDPNLNLEGLPSRGGEASEFTGAEQSATAPGQADSGDAGGPRYLLNEAQEGSNFRLGPVYFRLGAGVGFQFTDNFGDASENREPELTSTAGLYLTGNWEITKINDLSLTLGIGYTSYLGHPELNSTTTTFNLTPGTQIAYKFKIGAVSFNFFDSPSLGQDSSQLLTLQSGIIYNSFQNVAGLTAFLDLNDLTLQAGYTRSDTIPLTSQTNSVSGSQSEQQVDNTLDSLNRSVDTLSASATFRLQEDTSAGFNVSASRISYQEGGQSNGLSYSAGAFVGRQVTRFISLRLAAGYQVSDFGSGGSSNGDTGNSGGIYYNLGLTHRVNRNLSHALSISSESDLGTSTNTVQTFSVSEQITYLFAKDLALSAGLLFQRGEPSGGSFSTPFTLLSLSLSCGYNLTRKLSVGAFYAFTTRSGGSVIGDSENVNGLVGGGNNDYYSNTVGVNFSYAF